jgi:hypothetical protein
MSQPPCNIGAMKTARTISGILLFVSVASLDSAGAWWWVVLTLAFLSLGALFILCAGGSVEAPARSRPLTLLDSSEDSGRTAVQGRGNERPWRVA